jgi:uncharacterized C2H2 Zn-finger protein
MKKVMFSYYPSSKRPGNVGIRKRWKNKILQDIENFGIKSWRRNTMDRDSWRQLINQQVQVTPVHANIESIVRKYKEHADERRSQESKLKRGVVRQKVTEILVKDSSNYYKCPTCNKRFKPQEITGHVKSCATDWCKKHMIELK